MKVERTETIREAEGLVEKMLDFLSHHLATSNNMADLRRVMEMEARATIRRMWDAGYTAGIANAIGDRPSGDTGGKGTIVPPTGGTRLG
jgi:hypothetical protein